MEIEQRQTDIAIIGGGLTGLTAACYLAEAGFSVTLFEKAAKPGGRASTNNHSGYLFNRGAHAIYTGGAATEVMQELGINYPHGGPKDAYLYQQGALNLLPTGLGTLLQSKFLSVGDKLEFARVLTKLVSLKPGTVAHVSIQDWLDQIKSPMVRQVIAALARSFSYSTALELISMEMFAEKVQLILKNPIHYVDGGWQTLVDMLQQKARQAGAHIISSARVESVVTGDGQVQGVRLRDGQVINAAAVVVATSPKEAARLVDVHQHPAFHQMVGELLPGQLACLDVALSKLPSRFTAVIDMEQPRFLTIQSLFSRIAPEGGAMICLFKELHPEQHTDPHADERDLENFLDVLQPGWRDVLVKRVFLPRIDAVGTLPLARVGGYKGRPAEEVPGVRNLYLAGDWVGAEGFLLDTSMASARRVSRLLAEKKGLRVTQKVLSGSLS